MFIKPSKFQQLFILNDAKEVLKERWKTSYQNPGLGTTKKIGVKIYGKRRKKKFKPKPY